MERRKFSRISLNIPAALSFFQLEGCHSGVLTNISEGGCFFPFKGDLPVGEQCSLTIVIGEGIVAETFTISGTIVRSNSKGFGICFNSIDNNQKAFIRKIIVYYDSQ
ncbi:MAG: PilZ domain-containing protein [Desulfopila sp.]|jgi:hypothetical protein|nr:PilZ domain-containing protein [Desulfopila sp.]